MTLRSSILALALASAACTGDDDEAADDAATVDGGGSTSMAPMAVECDDAMLVWHTANKTTYESYPDPGSEECVKYNGCAYLGEFNSCSNTMPESWVMSHDIASIFPLGELGLHRLCVRSGATSMIVTVVDTCADTDCDGCCSENKGDAEALIDFEKYTNARWTLEDGPIEWADLGAGDPSFDGCN